MRRLILALVVTAALATATAGGNVGIIGCDTSHVLHFSALLNLSNETEFAGFRITHAYRWGSRDIVSCTNRWEKYCPKLIANKVAFVDSIAELLQKVDYVLLETNDGREHYAQALEVFKSGKPVFIDKPLAHDLADAIRIVDAAKRMGAKFFSCSGCRFAPGARAARSGELGVVRGADVWSAESIEPHHSRYFWYAIHAGEPLLTIMGPGVETAAATSCAYEDVVVGTWKDGRIGVMRALDFQRRGTAGGGAIFTERNGVVEMGRNKDYRPLLSEVFRFFRTGVAPVSPEETLEILAFLAAGEESRRLGGVPVSVPETMEKARAEARRRRN